ncbi:MAG TPA: PaaX family transcriptional regulator C-terminal domain-containing protein [Jatrophihabitans sp.]|jgi:phenylacetic acid degradation operon negative regulatory protein|uniref:PaaX family transcriptional regulator n=1 Tax=Jatrophihabitans sp. TaxID=1932789 RepID=UPI002EEF93DC
MSSAVKPAGASDELLVEAQPRQLIVTIYGLYAREEPNWLPIASVVRLMSDLGVDGQAVRSSISRLKRRATLQALRIDGAAGYALSPSTIQAMREGDRRIFDQRHASLADGWVQVVFTVPEAERGKRHELRTRLAGLGFGPVAPGVWLAPGALADEVSHVLARQQLAGYVDIFRGQYLGYAELAGRVGDWWDLEGLAAKYAQFLGHYRPVSRRLAGRAPDGGAAFAEYVRMLTAWRRLRYLDPGLPAEVLPPRWDGAAAAELFGELSDVLRPPAYQHALRVIRD